MGVSLRSLSTDTDPQRNLSVFFIVEINLIFVSLHPPNVYDCSVLGAR